jgi:hypothetical protein
MKAIVKVLSNDVIVIQKRVGNNIVVAEVKKLKTNKK